jgi:O-antigen/teichoic acid export membrane protein
MIEAETPSAPPVQISLKRNIAANFIGTIWQALMGLVFIPLYIKFMGIESWGLIGIFTTIQAVFSLLDLGLSSTLNRELARLSVLPNKEQEMRNLVRTLEIIYWVLALFVGIVITFLSPLIARYWIDPGKLSVETVEQALLIMGVVLSLQMPAGFYSGGLMGLQKQVSLNVINIIISTLRGGGAVLILWLISPTIKAFFIWQIISSSLNVLLLHTSLWRSLPQSEKSAVFQKYLLSGIWKFAAGMSGISILGVILTQMDKVILSKILSLEMFGYYMLASTVAMSLSRIFTPVFYSIYPRFTQLVSMKDEKSLALLYHKSAQFIAVLILPIAIIIALFSREILFLWTQNELTAEKTHLILSILICGTAANGLINAPYALQLAFGWTKLSFFKNIIAVILLVPLLIFFATQYGATGAAAIWLLLNVGYIVFEIPIMHSKLLKKEMWRWYWSDVCVPLTTCISIACLGRLFFTGSVSPTTLFINLLIISAITFTATVFTTHRTRIWVKGIFINIKSFGKKIEKHEFK